MTIIDLDNQGEYATSILEKGIFSNIEEVSKVAYYLFKQGMTYRNAYNKVKDMKWNFKYNGFTTEKIFYCLYTYSTITLMTGDFSNVILYDEEIEVLRKIPNYNSRRFSYFCLVVAKWNGHPSGWIKYDKDAMLCISGLKFKDYSEIVKECAKYGLLFRVIGSKNPITCYTLDFLKKEGKVHKILHNKKEIECTYQEVFGSV